MRAEINRTMTPTEWALLLTLATIWGSTFFFNAVALEVLPPLTIVAFRVGLASALLGLTVRVTGKRLPADLATWRMFYAMCLLNNVIPFSLIAWGQQHIPSGVAAILNATTPIFTVIVAHIYTDDERMTPFRMAGVILGLAGVVMMIGPDLAVEATRTVLGDAAVLAAALSYALSAVYARRFSRMGQSPMVTSAGMLIAAATIMVPVALLIDNPWTLVPPGIDVCAALVGVAVLSTFLAYLIYYRILATAGAVNIMLVTLLIPVSAVLLGTLFLGERLSLNHILGMVVIALGLVAIDGRPLRWLRRRA